MYDTANMFTPAQPDRLTAPVAGTYVVTGVAAINISGLTIGGPVAPGFVEIDEAGNSGSTHFIGLESFQADFNGQFAHEAAKPDNIPLWIMLYLTALVLWVTIPARIPGSAPSDG